MLKIIGLTGSIATGKSFVSEIIKNELNYPLIDADKLAREVVEINKPAYLEIVKNFGENILNENRELNRKKLREIVFNSEVKRKLLNSITHKYIKEEYQNKIEYYKKQGHELIFYDVPLLFEAKLEKEFYKIIVVYIPKNLQIERLMNRDSISHDDAIKIISSQIDIEEKKDMADFVIDNSKDRENTYNQVKTIIYRVSIGIEKENK
jgi:dephospho-CoA kinase